MVQVQGAWFPIINQNCQTFVENIFEAGAEACTGCRTPAYTGTADFPSSVSIPVLPALLSDLSSEFPVRG